MNPHLFRVVLTKEQATAFKQQWRDHGLNKGAILCQPVLNWGPFELTDCFLDCVLIDEHRRALVQEVLKPDPKPAHTAPPRPRRQAAKRPRKH